ncbi:MAG: hypothetical protein COA82_11225 [Alkaliphilus sp.]|nr:hypothetical protein [bacterium AH-315-L21]MBN4069436.1 hypothetical protein [bacterium AH-315-G05]MBN4074496.1 hypothetical protein [bacterium AH-315-E09]PHS30626.1 MAG: hypothetical protein COA82_11225 [Alkaliphilus sp.]
MRKNIFIMSILLIILLLINSNSVEVYYSVIATSFSDKETDISYYENENLIKKEHYRIGGIEKTYNNGKVLISKYSNELIDLNIRPEKFYVYKNPVDYLYFENGIYILHNEGVNSFSLKKYSEDYDIVLSSKIFKGYPMNFVAHHGLFYVLANVYDDVSNRTVKLYVVDSNKLEYVKEIIVKNQTFGFYVEENNNVLKIYGNKNEDTMFLALSEYNVERNKMSNSIEFDEKALWVDEVIRIKEIKFIVNTFSVIVLNEKNEIIRTLKLEDRAIIDCEYDSREKIFIVLAGNYQKGEFEVLTYDKNLTMLSKFKLYSGSRRPTDIVIINEL